MIVCQKMTGILDQSTLIHFNWFAQSASRCNDRSAVKTIAMEALSALTPMPPKTLFMIL